MRPNKLNCLNVGMLHYSLLFLAAFFILGVFEQFAHAESRGRIIERDEWNYFIGKNIPAPKWNHLGFDDSTWQRGNSPFGYGTDGSETTLSDTLGNSSKLFVRREFIVNPSKIKQINLSVFCDGSFIAYINGIEVARSKTKLTEPINISGFIHELLSGRNVLAIECSKNDINSSRFQLLPLLDIYEE